MIYFTADLHLGHKNILELCNRPFQTIEEMDQTLIDNWNKKVTNADTVYIVGDLIYKAEDYENYLSKLKGKKVLILGNHDNGWIDKIDKEKYFVKVSNLIEQSLENRMVTLCHYPMLEWRNSRKVGSTKLGYLIHGHIHNRTTLPDYLPVLRAQNALNAGVDINNYEPVTFKELLENNLAFKEKTLANIPMTLPLYW